MLTAVFKCVEERLARSGVGVGGVIILIGLLYFTGAGKWMLEGIQGIDQGCYQMLARIGTTTGESVCNALGKGAGAVTQLADSVSQELGSWKRAIEDNVPFLGSGSIDRLASQLGDAIHEFSSSDEKLSDMMRSGPSQVSASLGEQFQQAIDSFTIGQRYLDKDPSQAVTWLQHGASQPEGFGLSSQLSLGNLYAHGGDGIAANPARAQLYYQQAANSLSQLTRSNTPQSRQMLGTLPVSPGEMQQQIITQIRQIQSGMK